MKAVLCKQHGLPETLVLEDVPSPTPGPKEVVISVKACGVNFPDTLIIQNKYQFKPDLPFSPGGEIAGVVKAVGEGVKHVKPGDTVIALTGWGGFAEEVLTDAAKVFPVPPMFDFKVAATFAYAYGTSYYALKDRAQLKAGETLLVLGASGGVGLAAVQLGKVMGAKVIAAASTAEKLEVCRQSGADELVNYNDADWREQIKALTGGNGVDVVYDAVGGGYAEPALRSMAWCGRYLVVGFAAGDIPKIPLNLTLLKGCAIVGVFWGDFARRQPKDNMGNMMQLFAWLAQGQLKPHISAEYPLEQAAQALNDLLQRRATGKVVLVVE
ncbi:MAG: NADPH:quinone oxidoreductase family protein [Fluviicoccus sp.]|uniref:NADPH:quinone oxidoreductase family protein n=1 Tax=Fluviicoccus sp. TaxID=2003552 RepID=UPI0027248273|nr:NADPH:quinone oxidoreductase family protein [Fluviicoccus sp.]MDO8329833.1 NADPH:quinone oxidoreductase family protein [Fluviicoccus sp.]